MPQLTKSRDPELGPLELMTGVHKDMLPFFAYLGVKSQHLIHSAALVISPNDITLIATVYVDDKVKEVTDGGRLYGQIFLQDGDKMQKKTWHIRAAGDTGPRSVASQNALLRVLGFDAFEAINNVKVNFDSNSIVTMQVEYTMRTTGGWDKVPPGFVVKG